MENKRALIYCQSPEEFREDVKRAKAYLENLIGKEVVGYIAPSFSITDCATDILLIFLWKFHNIKDESQGFKEAKSKSFKLEAHDAIMGKGGVNETCSYWHWICRTDNRCVFC